MKTIAPKSVKLAVPFKAGELPQIAPEEPQFELTLGGLKILVRVNAKAARKLGVWKGSAVLQGNLVNQSGKLALESAGFGWIDPKPEAEQPPVALPPLAEVVRQRELAR